MHQNRQGNVRVVRIAIFAAVLLALALLIYFASVKVQEYREVQTQEELQRIFDGEASAEKLSFSLFPSARAEEVLAEGERPISQRLRPLWEINSDVIGWLEMGNDISTPIVYRNNEYYLEHDFYGKTSKSGTVFLDAANQEWETEPYMLVYGHNMKNGTMFGMLDKYQQLDYFKENLNIQFHSLYEDEVTVYLPFAVVDASMDKNDAHYMKLRSFSSFDEEADPDAAEAFIAEIRDRSVIEIPGLEVTAEDRILGMVTCSYVLKDARVTVFCRELREDENQEEMLNFILENAKEKGK